MNRWTSALLLACAAAISTEAVTRLPSADGQYWDIQDTSDWSQDSGGIATGGRANPFNGFGYLKLQVGLAGGVWLSRNQYLHGFGLSHDGERFDSITPVLQNGLVVERGIFAPKDTNYLRYVDSFTNVSDEPRMVRVAWGGAAGAFEDGGRATVATTADGNRTIDLTDSFVTVMQNAKRVADPMRGPSGHGPSAHVLGTKTSGVLAKIGDMYADPFVDAWPGYDPAHIGYVFSFTVEPGRTVSLMTFVVKGLSEVYDPRGGFPIALTDALVAPKNQAPFSQGTPAVPAAGSQIAEVTAVARRLAGEPDLRGLTPRQRQTIVNWRMPATAPLSPFTAVEKTIPQLQEALTSGAIDSEDIVREYLRRLSTYDRRGLTLRAMLALNPHAIADARALDQERAAGRVRGPLHGIPVAYKDNIDVLGLPTTGGSRALADHRPRLDSRMAAGMRRGGAIVLGKANLDEFPFGDFGISSVAGTIGNAFDPSLSTSGSSGGSAVAVASSFVTLGFGTDTCNSLSNPASFASLATIRTTRGLTSRAGVMPLNTFNDAVGPLAKSVRELAIVLDHVAGSDPEDEVTLEADEHIQGLALRQAQGERVGARFAPALDGASLKGARFGVVRQLFVGVTGEKEVAGLMESVVSELKAAGADVVDVTIPNLDAEYRTARGSAPGSLKAGWTAYLSRGAKAGDKVLTLEDLLASGKLAPGSARRFQDALQPVPAGDALKEATARFYAGREGFRNLFVNAMEQQRLDALVYPANQARPHTHEGGLERYGGEPGTCEESAMTGLPQVTVPAGFIGGRYPVGVSFLGRLWSDARMLSLAYAYEQATHHRRPPPFVK
jgi:amidase